MLLSTSIIPFASHITYISNPSGFTKASRLPSRKCQSARDSGSRSLTIMSNQDWCVLYQNVLQRIACCYLLQHTYTYNSHQGLPINLLHRACRETTVIRKKRPTAATAQSSGAVNAVRRQLPLRMLLTRAAALPQGSQLKLLAFPTVAAVPIQLGPSSCGLLAESVCCIIRD